MASVRREVIVDSSPENTWDAVRDFGALDRRLVPGFVTAVQVDGTSRTVTFANGTQAREVLVDSDDKARRLVYAVVGADVSLHTARPCRSSLKEAARKSSGFQTSCRTSSRPISPSQMDEAAKAMKKALG